MTEIIINEERKKIEMLGNRKKKLTWEKMTNNLYVWKILEFCIIVYRRLKVTEKEKHIRLLLTL